ncbi:MAG: hypothetical protein V2I57_08685 [Xanthomonadales bacterium]|nr:hypothetical protein [Xanthomonadales bacterium]
MNKQPWLLLFAMALIIAAQLAAASTSNKWRLQFSGGANSDGTIVIRLSPKEGEALEAAVDIEDGRSENGVAKDVVSGLKEQVGDRFHVERDDGEDVLIKKRRGNSNFGVEVISNTVKGVRINLDRE